MPYQPQVKLSAMEHLKRPIVGTRLSFHTAWVHLHEVSKAVKFTEAKGRTVLTRDWRERENSSGLMGIVWVPQDAKVLEICLTTMWRYFTWLKTWLRCKDFMLWGFFDNSKKVKSCKKLGPTNTSEKKARGAVWRGRQRRLQREEPRKPPESFTLFFKYQCYSQYPQLFEQPFLPKANLFSLDTFISCCKPTEFN